MKKLGAITALISSLPLAMLMARVYRFPIPFLGYAHSGKYLSSVPFAWFFYGILGGFIVMIVGGAFIGATLDQRIKNVTTKKCMIIIIASVYATCGVTFLAVLEEIIGPW